MIDNRPGYVIPLFLLVQYALVDWGSRWESAERKLKFCFDPWNLIQVMLAKESQTLLSYLGFIPTFLICTDFINF